MWKRLLRKVMREEIPEDSWKSDHRAGEISGRS